jgi:glycosyltransferase involved in cell wall biosynthesis
MSRRLALLVNGLHAKTGGGITYLNALLPRFAARDDIDLHLLLHEKQLALFPAVGTGVTLHVVGFKDGFLRRLIWEQIVLPFKAWSVADVTFSPANFGPILAPRPVVLLRNALAVGRFEARFAKRLYWKVLGLMTWLSLLAAPRALAVSDYAKRSLSFCFSGKVATVHHGCDRQIFHPPIHARQERLLLAVGDITVQKNYRTLLDALATVEGVELAIVGQRVDEEHAQELDDLVRSLGLDGRVRFLGKLLPADLAELYRRCSVFVFPSTAETFGNPLVEAMAAGCAILSSDAAAMPEILGDAGLYAPALDAGAWAANIRRIVAEPGLASSLSRKAQERAQLFDWDRTASATLEQLKMAGLQSPSPVLARMAWIWVIFVLSLYLWQFREMFLLLAERFLPA